MCATVDSASQRQFARSAAIAVATPCLIYAEGWLAHGDRKQALGLYDGRSRTNIPKAIRLAALHNAIAT